MCVCLYEPVNSVWVSNGGDVIAVIYRLWGLCGHKSWKRMDRIDDGLVWLLNSPSNLEIWWKGYERIPRSVWKSPGHLENV